MYLKIAILNHHSISIKNFNAFVFTICIIHYITKCIQECAKQKFVRDSFEKIWNMLFKQTTILQISWRLSSTNFTWSILEYFVYVTFFSIYIIIFIVYTVTTFNSTLYKI